MEPQSATICYNDYLDMILLKELFSFQNDHGKGTSSEGTDLAWKIYGVKLIICMVKVHFDHEKKENTLMTQLPQRNDWIDRGYDKFWEEAL